MIYLFINLCIYSHNIGVMCYGHVSKFIYLFLLKYFFYRFIHSYILFIIFLHALFI